MNARVCKDLKEGMQGKTGVRLEGKKRKHIAGLVHKGLPQDPSSYTTKENAIRDFQVTTSYLKGQLLVVQQPNTQLVTIATDA